MHTRIDITTTEKAEVKAKGKAKAKTKAKAKAKTKSKAKEEQTKKEKNEKEPPKQMRVFEAEKSTPLSISTGEEKDLVLVKKLTPTTHGMVRENRYDAGRLVSIRATNRARFWRHTIWMIMLALMAGIWIGKNT